MSLVDDRTHRIVPEFEPGLENPFNGLIMQTIHWSMNSIYEYESKEQLMKYYNPSLGSHTRYTLYTAAKASYLQGCPGLTLEAINKYILIEDAAYGIGPHASDSCRQTIHNQKEGQLKNHYPVWSKEEGGGDRRHWYQTRNQTTITKICVYDSKTGWFFYSKSSDGSLPQDILQRKQIYLCVLYLWFQLHKRKNT